MSRNLASTDCYYCDGEVVLDEKPRPITKEDYGSYDEYVGMLVANATCSICEAKYLAWVNRSYMYNQPVPDDQPFGDLSFRSTFNDEPGIVDLPTYKIKRIVTYEKTPWPICADCGTPYTYASKDYCYECDVRARKTS